jgi:hypothetical protein
VHCRCRPHADTAVAVLPPPPPLCCSRCSRCPAALPPRSLLLLSCLRCCHSAAAVNLALPPPPPRCLPSLYRCCLAALPPLPPRCYHYHSSFAAAMRPLVSRFLMPLPPLLHCYHHAAFNNTALMRLRCRRRLAALFTPLCCRHLSHSAAAIAMLSLPPPPCHCRCPATLPPRCFLPLSCPRRRQLRRCSVAAALAPLTTPPCKDQDGQHESSLQ